ncbi:hypothetical protein NGRA_1883 [Nosema granulosis]|uniref:Uncharacterized protein n=1 Tax=Nosema granulosis TaxID=83296 RepID=A0A9P6KYY5_9MICR|nr:hypothetical protein NGRA_1883 [Nosema granulosis]
MKQLKTSKILMKFIATRDDFKLQNNVQTCLLYNKELTYPTNEGNNPSKKHLETELHVKIKNIIVSWKNLEDSYPLKLSNKTFYKDLVEIFKQQTIRFISTKTLFLKSF